MRRIPNHRRSLGFSLMELLVVLGIVAVIAGVVLPTILRSQRAAERADSTARLRSMSQAVLLYAVDNTQTLPGPLWPGQVMLFDPAREGRLVRDLAEYLQVERRDAPYLVDRMVPLAYRRAMKGTKLEDARIYVMNSSATRHGEVLDPFASGSLTKPGTGLNSVPLKLSAVQGLTGEGNWMMAEADQKLPAVASAVWRTSTPPAPVHGNARAIARFDGSAAWEQFP